MKRHRKIKVLPPIKLNEFPLQWRAWWVIIQPSWRQEVIGSSWPPPQATASKSDWKSLKKAGPNGFYLVMLTLSWWGWAIANSSAPVPYTEFDIAVADVEWVLSNIIQQLAPASTSMKRPSADDKPKEEPRAKRYVHSNTTMQCIDLLC